MCDMKLFLIVLAIDDREVRYWAHANNAKVAIKAAEEFIKETYGKEANSILVKTENNNEEY